ncbi:MAG: hypothetical protein JRF56_06215 [Deltaproteobacteria bacterium]|nr:hypothetical protein [Deltaproteobacteria bacterium]
MHRNTPPLRLAWSVWGLGALFYQEFADDIGSDGYARDGGEAITLV